MPALTLVYKRLSEVAPNPRNPKGHDVEGIKKSIRRFGFVDPLIEDGRDGSLLSGHGRTDVVFAILAEDRDKGLDPPNGIVVEDGEWMVPVVQGTTTVNDAEQSALVISLNQHVIEGGWDNQGLVAMLAQIQDTPSGFEGVGFTSEAYQDLMATLAGPPALDDLLANPPGDSDFWPVLRFKVPPQLRARYLAVVADVDGGDVEQFQHLVAKAEAAKAKAKAKA